MTDRTCSVSDCGGKHHCKGYCQPHYMRLWHYGDPLRGGPIKPRVFATEENFWARVDKNGPTIEARPDLGPCWPWTGNLNEGGYGTLGCRRGFDRTAHRISWVRANGCAVPIDKELDHICHSLDLTCPGGVCEHRRCVNPDHLEPVTHRENGMRGVTGRMTECSEGHALVVVGLRNGHPKRGCPTCIAARKRANRDASAVTPGVRAPSVAMTAELLSEVATVYRAAVVAGEAPRLAAARHFRRSPATISDWLRKARDAGILAAREQ